jgi:hypothetical protein
VTVQLRNWPAAATVQVSTCGNKALNGNSDCDNSGSITAVTDRSGAFTGTMKFTRPPKPCPCVLFAFSTQSPATNRFSIDLVGYPSAPTVIEGGTRSLEVRAEIEGGGPLSSWFGGAAERELVLTILNTGTLPVADPPTVVTYGRGEDPTELLARPRIGDIQPSTATEVRIPFELPAGSFGSYTVKTTIGGLDQPTAARASTSTYPWFLLVGLWLLIQIPLLGLHKRRVDDELFDESELLELDDPFRGLVPGAPVGARAAAGAATAGAAAAGGVATDAVPGWASAATGLAAGAAVAAGAATAVLDRPGTTPPSDSGLPAWAAAAVAPEAAASAAPATPAVPVTPAGAPSAVAAIAAAMGGAALAGAGAASAASDAGGAGRGGYGVDHLLGIVSPGTATPPPATVAARVVVAGTTPKR